MIKYREFIDKFNKEQKPPSHHLSRQTRLKLARRNREKRSAIQEKENTPELQEKISDIKKIIINILTQTTPEKITLVKNGEKTTVNYEKKDPQKNDQVTVMAHPGDPQYYPVITNTEKINKDILLEKIDVRYNINLKTLTINLDKAIHYLNNPNPILGGFATNPFIMALDKGTLLHTTAAKNLIVAITEELIKKYPQLAEQKINIYIR